MLISTITTWALWIGLVPRAAQHGTAGTGHPSHLHPESGLGGLAGCTKSERTLKPPVPTTRRRPPGRVPASSAPKKIPPKNYSKAAWPRSPHPEGTAVPPDGPPCPDAALRLYFKSISKPCCQSPIPKRPERREGGRRTGRMLGARGDRGMGVGRAPMAGDARKT